MTLSDYDSDEDADYLPSESEESDELEYDSDVSVSSEEELEEVVEDVPAESWMQLRPVMHDELNHGIIIFILEYKE